VRQRIGSGQRNWHRLVPASSGAKAPLACEDRWLVGCARASYSVAEVGERRRGSKKRVSRWLRGAWTGTQLSRSPQGVTGECKGVDNQHRGGQAAELGKARAGRSRGRCGAKVFVRRKASQVVHRHVRSRGRVEGGLGGPHETRNARASREARGRRQGCQRLGPHASRREDNARRDDSSREQRATRRSELHCRRNRQSISSATRDAQASRRSREPTRRGYSYVDVRMAEVGPTHRASRCLASRKASR
jgi:hypothetical protein